MSYDELKTIATDPGAGADAALAALAALREVREELAAWEPELIATARAHGVSWADIAPALGVASRQAAERRYLRLRPSAEGHATGEERVRAERSRRAGVRAVNEWARDNAAALRGLAGRGGASDVEQGYLDDLHTALGADEPSALLEPLAAVQGRLRETDPGLAEEIAEMTGRADEVRRDRR
ncbi:HSP18 transcriptional regulator [Umezawaea beigongshangensis]|uniref:HSP18 transcriptional regulator n=1 Tax=Umezawaea beigongshangensis TaxID=2780383 RepID=UPI0018F14B70|nr:HSP18 transcriptional regulator [Umezawaea beigongshangensis]